MAAWHHRLNGHKFKQASGVGDGQGSLVCCSPWGHKESDMTEAAQYVPKGGVIRRELGPRSRKPNRWEGMGLRAPRGLQKGHPRMTVMQELGSSQSFLGQKAGVSEFF